jgi:translation elongation factor EF-Tu-like GTPase
MNQRLILLFTVEKRPDNEPVHCCNKVIWGKPRMLDFPDIAVEITYLSVEDGGKKLPVSSGYRPQFYYDGHDWDAIHEYPDVNLVYPGQTARALLSFLSPDAHVGKLYVGKEFQIREGQHVVAQGKVIQILHLEESAKKK